MEPHIGVETLFTHIHICSRHLLTLLPICFSMSRDHPWVRVSPEIPCVVYTDVEPASAFISLSSNLSWSLKNALKAFRGRGGSQLNCSLILSSKLDPKAVYYVRPLLDSVRVFKPFTQGKWMYRASSEWWYALSCLTQCVTHAHSYLSLEQDIPRDSSERHTGYIQTQQPGRSRE